MEKEKTYGVWAVRSAASIFGRAESWCKEAGRPLEFASQETAEAYAKECNSRTTANVHYFVKEKEPEPGAVRKDGTQPDRAARAHEEQTPRNAAMEKLNEIPGRQLSKDPDPLVEIRSAVHSKVWMFYHEQTNDPILAYALTLDGLQDGKVTGTIYPLDYPSHVERVKSLSCPIDRVTVTFEDGVQFTLPYQSRRRQINELMPEHGTPKSMQYAPESERELAVILRRERLKRDYHAKPGNVQEYMEKLKKASMRGRLKEAQAAVAAPGRGAPHKGGLDR